MPKSKEMTIGDLAVMIKKGFDEVHEKFDGVDGKFRGVDGKFVEMDGKFEKIDKRFDEIHEKMDLELGAIRSDIRDIKGTLGPLVRSTASLETDYSNLRMRVSYLEQKVGVEK
jgi:tetrahydromethanopterin S-methyltransferase subunit G